MDWEKVNFRRKENYLEKWDVKIYLNDGWL